SGRVDPAETQDSSESTEIFSRSSSTRYSVRGRRVSFSQSSSDSRSCSIRKEREAAPSIHRSIRGSRTSRRGRVSISPTSRNSGHSNMTLEFSIFRYDSRVPQDSCQYLSAIFGNSSRDLYVLVISQNIVTCSIMLNFLNVQMPPRREPDHPAPTQATVVAQFYDYHAEKFSGQGDPRIVDEWIQGLEFILEVMDCPDRYRVVCAQLQLTGDARLWWNAYWSMRPGEKAGCTWEMLKEIIREKYYPTYYRAEMERQFLSLQQGTRTVDEYEREFTRLAAFAMGHRHTLVQFLLPRRWMPALGGRLSVIVPSHPPQFSHSQLYQLYQLLSRQRRRRGRGRAHKPTGGPDRDSSRFH
ncbi:Unknown protein, partial [Striga hermonthica]